MSGLNVMEADNKSCMARLWEAIELSREARRKQLCFASGTVWMAG